MKLPLCEWKRTCRDLESKGSEAVAVSSSRASHIPPPRIPRKGVGASFGAMWCEIFQVKNEVRTHNEFLGFFFIIKYRELYKM